MRDKERASHGGGLAPLPPLPSPHSPIAIPLSRNQTTTMLTTRRLVRKLDPSRTRRPGASISFYAKCRAVWGSACA